MEISNEHLVNYDVYFSFDNSFGDNKKQEFITSFSFGKLTDKKPVFTSGRKQFVAIETNTSLIAGRIVTFAQDKDNGTPLPYLLDFVNESVFGKTKTAMYYQSVDEIEIPVHIFFYNKVSGKTFSFNDMVFTNVSSEKDVTSGKVLYVIDYFCSTLTPSPKSILVDEKTTTVVETSTPQNKVKNLDSTLSESKPVDVSSAGNLLLNDVGQSQSDYYLFEYETSKGGPKILFNIPNILLSLNSSFHKYEISFNLKKNGLDKKLVFIFPALALEYSGKNEDYFLNKGQMSFLGVDNIVRTSNRDSIKNQRVLFISNQLKSICDYVVDSLSENFEITVGDKFYFKDSIPIVNSVAGLGLIVVPYLNVGLQTLPFFSIVEISKQYFFTEEHFGSIVSFGYYNVSLDGKDYLVSEFALQVNDRINEKNIFDLQMFKAVSQVVYLDNVPSETNKITLENGDFLSKYALIKDTYVLLDKTKNELKSVVRFGVLSGISSNLSPVAGSYIEKIESISSSNLHINLDVNSFAINLPFITSFYYLSKLTSFTSVQLLGLVFYIPSSDTFFEGEKVFHKGVECSLVLKVAKDNYNNEVVSVYSTSGKGSYVLSGSSIFVLDKTFKDDKNNDCYVSISNLNEVSYFLKSDLLDYSSGDVILITKNHTVTYTSEKVTDASTYKPENNSIPKGFVKDLFESYFKKRFKRYEQKRPVPLLADISEGKDFTDCSALVWAYFVKTYGASELQGKYPDTKTFRDKYLPSSPLVVFSPDGDGSLKETEVNSFSFQEEDIILFVSDKPIYKKYERHIGLVSIKDDVKYFCDISFSSGNVITQTLYKRINSITKSYKSGKNKELVSCHVYRGRDIKLVYDTKK